MYRLLSALLLILVVQACHKDNRLNKEDALIGTWEFLHARATSGDQVVADQYTYSDESILIRFKRNKLWITKNGDPLCSCRFSLIGSIENSSYYLATKRGCKGVLPKKIYIEMDADSGLVIDRYPYYEESHGWHTFHGNFYRRSE